MRMQSLHRSHARVTFWRNHLLITLLALVSVSLFMLVNAPRALACPVCISPDKITLSGDGVIGTASVTDPGVLAWFGAGAFMGFEQRSPIATPVHTGIGVELTRYYKNTGVPASFWTTGFDHMRYYPGAVGQPGYTYYEGPVSAEARDYGSGLNMWQRTGKWYALTSDEDAHLRQLLTAASASPQNSSVAPPPVTSPDASNTSGPLASLRILTSIPLAVIILLACLVALVATVGYRLRHTRHHPPFAPAEDTAD